jgi:hypothetical protein
VLSLLACELVNRVTRFTQAYCGWDNPLPIGLVAHEAPISQAHSPTLRSQILGACIDSELPASSVWRCVPASLSPPVSDRRGVTRFVFTRRVIMSYDWRREPCPRLLASRTRSAIVTSNVAGARRTVLAQRPRHRSGLRRHRLLPNPPRLLAALRDGLRGCDHQCGGRLRIHS